MTFVLPDLPFDYAALEPYIDATTMHLHHDKHHQTYIDKLNASLDGVPQAAGKSIEQLLTGLDALPESVRVSVRNNGGGHYNHSLFWTMLSPESTIKPDGQLLADLESTFDSFDNFKAEFSQAALSVFGSGWAWLVKDNATLKNCDDSKSRFTNHVSSVPAARLGCLGARVLLALSKSPTRICGRLLQGHQLADG
ncbi:superoxide dismutase [Lacticaseibacillus paracasei subsp. paracasei Lpp227]|nr:superoxide dismutase [Lacticaseibacillus paracasei subsp. paracasei Lpp227]